MQSTSGGSSSQSTKPPCGSLIRVSAGKCRATASRVRAICSAKRRRSVRRCTSKPRESISPAITCWVSALVLPLVSVFCSTMSAARRPAATKPTRRPGLTVFENEVHSMVLPLVSKAWIGRGRAPVKQMSP